MTGVIDGDNSNGMAKFSVTEFAASLAHPVSRVRINQLVARGDLIRGKDKKIDTKNPTNAAWIATRNLAPIPNTGKAHGEPQAPWQTPIDSVPPGERNSVVLEDGLDGFDADAILSQVANLNFTTLPKIQIDKIHKLEALLKVRVERQHKRRELIERSLVQSVFSRLYTVDVNELRTLGAKLAPAISGILGCDDPEVVLAVEKTIDNEVIKSLSHIKRIVNDFLVLQGAATVGDYE